MRTHCFRLDWRHDIGEGFAKGLPGLHALDHGTRIDALNDWISELENIRDKMIMEARDDAKERQA